MKRASCRVRGAALAETAIVLSFTLLVIFGAIQIALIGFFQTQLDGATFMYSHAAALGSSNYTAIDASLGPIFPSVPMTTWGVSNITDANPLSTNTTTMPNWTQWGSLTQRFGGSAILRSQLVQTKGTMTVNGLSVLGNSITLSAGNVEGMTMVGNHDDDAQGAGYNSPTVYSSLVNPITQDDQNVPPYYFTFAYMSYCTLSQFSSNGSSCSSWYSGGGLRSLGLAEYLKDDQTGNAGNYTTSADGIGTNGTFQTMACHQRIFADLATAFPSVMPAPSPIPGSNYDETSSGPASVAAWNGASFRMVYTWDVQGTHGEYPGSKSFANGYPLNPTYGCTDGGPGS
ncbi:MAG: TadE/TadG family type IV pilus assembly protein [Candidatus Tyrphobacter sp.]